MAGGLQAALPREHYVDEATHAVERSRVLLREWTCAVGSTTSGSLLLKVACSRSG